MNFGTVIKAEITDKPIKDDSSKRAFIMGIIRGAGELYEKDGEIGLDFCVHNEKTAELVGEYLKSLYNYEVREVSVSEDKLNKRDKFIISIFGGNANEVLRSLKIIDFLDGGYDVNYDFYKEINTESTFKAFMRGLFISSGVCTVPDDKNAKTGYHLEISFSHYKTAVSTSQKLEKYGINTKITRRKNDFILYIKSAEEIKDFIAFLPAPVSVIKLTDIMVNREFVNIVNRRKNCDLGNVNRQVEASYKQVEAIINLEKTIGLSNLKEDLLTTAIARKENPDLTLNELAEKLNISKSCLNHRLRKLIILSNTKED